MLPTILDSGLPLILTIPLMGSHSAESLGHCNLKHFVEAKILSTS